ncbi:dihydrofolate reductase [Arthrobacter cryoconiti]|uniref:dihydrofolate reductase n=1 Tax=Arthrobacter cryoconiti TaxID=748907 RepID=A0ABV8QZ59_9MICC|nr:dihydrofolate reductase [Arthrobacter cryoconiti]MCC9069171.1 dihydrofolate reductase [Arthrobacter cryoconiti]
MSDSTPVPELYSFNQPIVGMIWAQTVQGIIGADGGMPWHLPEDMAHFKRVTSGHPVVMGRRTWESFPQRFRPLPQRTNIVVTRQQNWAGTPDAAGAVVHSDLAQALVEAQRSPGCEEVWVLGGGEVFRQAMGDCNVAVITVINTDVPGDTQAPTLGPAWTFRGATPSEGWHTSKNGTEYRFTLWAKGSGELRAAESAMGS